jgi:hypothetical protein
MGISTDFTVFHEIITVTLDYHNFCARKVLKMLMDEYECRE